MSTLSVDLLRATRKVEHEYPMIGPAIRCYRRCLRARCLTGDSGETRVVKFQRIKTDDIGDAAMAGLHVKPNKQSVPQSEATNLF